METFVFRPSQVANGIRIPLRPLSTQLVFTVIMALSELLFVSSFLVLHAYGECRILAREKLLSVKSHVRRIKMIHLLALAMFFMLEVLMSLFNKEYDRPAHTNQDCISTVENRKTKISEKELRMEDQYVRERELVLFSCFQLIENRTVAISAGSFGFENDTVMCSEGPPLFKYSVGGISKESGQGRQWYKSCHENVCVGMFSEGKNVFFSSPYERDHNFTEYSTEGRWSSLRYDPSPSLEVMVKELLLFFMKGDLDDLHLRHKLFTDLKKEKCKMISLLRKGTVVPSPLVIVTASLWVLSVIMFLITRFIKKNVFYDMHDPLHWAKNHSGSLNEPEKDETAHIKLCGQGDQGHVVVTFKTNAKRPDAGYHDNSEF